MDTIHLKNKPLPLLDASLIETIILAFSVVPTIYAAMLAINSLGVLPRILAYASCSSKYAGAGRIICGSIAVDNRNEFTAWLSEFGPSRIILGADVRDGKVATHGWLKDSGLSLEELMGWYQPCGLSQMICTDISKDGMLQGPDFDFYVALKQAFPTVDVTLSGGISCMDDIEKAAQLQLHSVIVGKAIYEGKISMKEIESWLLKG